MTEPDRLTFADRQPPRWRLIYLVAYGSLVPLAALALLLWWPQAPARAALGLALTSYSAMLASFIGGFHWGIGLRYMATTSEMPTFHFVWGAIAAFGGWFGVLMTPAAGMPFLALMFVVCYLVDHRTWDRAGLSEGLTLRFHGTVVAVLSCLIGAAGSM